MKKKPKKKAGPAKKRGYSWRILAWSNGEPGSLRLHSPEYVQESNKSAKFFGYKLPPLPKSEITAGSFCFDELVLDDWLHLEQMSNRSWWMRVGDAHINVFLAKDGTPTVNVERGLDGVERGFTRTFADHEADLKKFSEKFKKAAALAKKIRKPKSKTNAKLAKKPVQKRKKA